LFDQPAACRGLSQCAADQKGNLIRDLRQEDFEVFEDGSPQTVIHFSVGTAARSAASMTSAPSGPPRNPGKPAEPSPPAPSSQGRYVVLAVDDYHLVPESLSAV
jgi:hypothetical protein